MMVSMAGVNFSNPVMKMSDSGTVEMVAFSTEVREIGKFVSKGFKLPTVNSMPPYFVEYPDEEDDESSVTKLCIPSYVEDA